MKTDEDVVQAILVLCKEYSELGQYDELIMSHGKARNKLAVRRSQLLNRIHALVARLLTDK